MSRSSCGLREVSANQTEYYWIAIRHGIFKLSFLHVGVHAHCGRDGAGLLLISSAHVGSLTELQKGVGLGVCVFGTVFRIRMEQTL